MLREAVSKCVKRRIERFCQFVKEGDTACYSTLYSEREQYSCWIVIFFEKLAVHLSPTSIVPSVVPAPTSNETVALGRCLFPLALTHVSTDSLSCADWLPLGQIDVMHVSRVKSDRLV
jgi:hypothetical protein